MRRQTNLHDSFQASFQTMFRSPLEPRFGGYADTHHALRCLVSHEQLNDTRHPFVGQARLL
jgi:hypothetical protein